MADRLDRWSTEKDALVNYAKVSYDYSIVVCDGKVYAITYDPDIEAYGAAYEIPPGGCVYNPSQCISYCVEEDGSGVYTVHGDHRNWEHDSVQPDEIVYWGDKFCKLMGVKRDDYIHEWSTEKDALVNSARAWYEYDIVVCDGKVYAIAHNPDKEAYGAAYEIPPGECAYNRYQDFSYCVSKDGSSVCEVYGSHGNWQHDSVQPDAIVRWDDKFCKLLGVKRDDYIHDDDYDEEDEEEMEMGM